MGVTLFAATVQAQNVDKTALTLDGAKKIAAVAEVKAKAEGVRLVIAVVDESGNLLFLHRLDDTQVASVNVGTAARLQAGQVCDDDGIGGDAFRLRRREGWVLGG